MVLLLIAALAAVTPQSSLDIQPRKISERNPDYSIEIKYPEIANAKEFNDSVQQALKPVLESFKKNAVRDPACNYSAYLNGYYSATNLRSGIVSVLLRWSEYTPCAAHPWGSMASVNFDTRTGRVLKLSDLFRLGVPYVSRISQLAIASLSRQDFADSHAVHQGAGPDESNFKVFTLTETSLVLHFPTYQVAPGAAGPQTVEISLDKLAPLVRER